MVEVTLTATHCNTLQHTATHCNTLQHTATQCNTLQHTISHRTQADSHLLVETGELEHIAIARRVRARFPHLFDTYHSRRHRFRSSCHERAARSAHAFTQGLFPANAVSSTSAAATVAMTMHGSTPECNSGRMRAVHVVTPDCLRVATGHGVQCIYINIYIYIYIDVYIHVHIYMYTCTYIYVFSHVCTYICIYNIHICIYLRVHICVYICIYMYMCKHKCTYMYGYIYS